MDMLSLRVRYDANKNLISRRVSVSSIFLCVVRFASHLLALTVKFPVLKALLCLTWLFSSLWC